MVVLKKDSGAFSVGTQVEVSSCSDVQELKVGGYGHCAWYRAIILRLPRNPCCTTSATCNVQVQYLDPLHHNLLEEPRPLTHDVDSALIRPLPPQSEGGSASFWVNDVVDVWYRYGWWRGVVIQVINNYNYSVRFRNPPFVQEFGRSDVRPHWDWLDGSWCRPQDLLQLKRQIVARIAVREMVAVKGDNGAFSVGTQVEVSSCSDVQELKVGGFGHCAWYRAIILQLPRNPSCTTSATCNVQVQYLDPLNRYLFEEPRPLIHNVDLARIRPLPPQSDGGSVSFWVSDVVDVWFHDGWWRGVVIQVIDNYNYSVKFRNPPFVQEFGRSDVRPHWDWLEGSWSRPQETKQQGVKRQESQQRESGRLPKPQIKNLQDSAAGKVRNAEGDAAAEIVEGNRLDSTGVGASKAAYNFRRLPYEDSRQKRFRGPEYQTPLPVKRRGRQQKRGRQPTSQHKSTPVSAALKEGNAKGDAAEEIVEVAAEEIVEEVETSEGDGLDSTGMSGPKAAENISQLPNEENRQQREGVKDPEGPARDAQVALREEATLYSGTVEVAIAGVSSNTADDDQALSMGLEGTHSPTLLDDSGFSPGRTANQGPEENQGLPFMKSSPMWKLIESSEVFKIMPQKPHFHPLAKEKEPSREGLAFAQMITFSNMVEKTFKLRADDPRNFFESILETVFDLEMHGFDVKAVRGRLNQLLSIKNKQGELLDQLKEAERSIKELADERAKCIEEIVDADKKLKELEEKRTMAMSMKEKNDFEIGNRLSNIENINEGLRIAQRAFSSLATSPW